MDIIIPVLALLLTIGIPLLGIVFLIKRKAPTGGISGQIGPRRRDGVLTFNEFRGMRSNVEVEDPRGTHNQRYQRRHTARQPAKPTKPWMK
jgi:hypothetical protein